MRKNIQRVIDAYKQGKSAKGDSKATCSTDGTKVWSYWTVIAERQTDGSTKVVSEDGFSRTTKSQIRALNYELGK